jgi:8-oxo-dGTP pyrophosphatase MutT (NUDIX family)
MTKFAYHGKYIQIEESFIEGKLWEKAYFRPGIVIFPITDEGKIILVKEKRPHENPTFRLKPVTGIFEPEFSVEENALREMQEEIGRSAKTIELFLELQSTGTVNNKQYFVLAKELFAKKVPNPDGEDSIQEILEVTINELEEMVWSMKLPWGQSTLGIFKLLRLLSLIK